jgi:hypothetical protein
MKPFPNRSFMQMCWVVPDIYIAVQNWVEKAGVGPFFLFEKVVFDNPVYRGRPAENVEIVAAMAQAGDVQIELVCQLDDRPSIFRDVVAAKKVGANHEPVFHHMALYCTDYRADLDAYTRAGSEVAFSGLMMGARTCWIDTTSQLGFMVELIEANPIADTVFAQFRSAAQDWDGNNPIRTMS